MGRKIFGTLLILPAALIYAAVVILLLVRFAGLQIEWRGGYIPALTWNKTTTDLAALERNRAAQGSVAAATSSRRNTSTYWSGFRGPAHDGRYDEEPILTNWPANGLRLLWKQPCGGGYSSFAIAEGRAFTIEQRGEDEMVVAYDMENGRELWTNGWPSRFTEMHSDEGPRATPVWTGGKVYALGATGEFRCLDAATGKEFWGTNIVSANGGRVPEYGMAASPLIVDDKIVVQTYARNGSAVVCYNKDNGSVLWRALDLTMGYASPALVTIGGERQVVVCGRPHTIALRLEDGVERWRILWEIVNHERQIAQPVVLGTNRLLLSAAYLTGSLAFEVNRNGDSFETKELWRTRNLKNKFASSVFHDGFVYGLDEDILTCIDAASGERKWKDGRYGYGQVVLASGHLVVLCGNGDLALVKATPDAYVELARVPALQGKTWNYPAISDGWLLIRNGAEMACFDISAGPK